MMKVTRYLFTACYFWLWLFSVSTPLLAAEISVLPDRNPVGIGEEFTLTFSTTEEPDANPDFAPLRENFEITGTTTSSNIQMINGVVSRAMSWQVRLYPKATGTLEIPPVGFGSQSSPPGQITVEDTATGSGVPRDGVLVELDVDTDSPYVQQQFIVTQRMLHSVELMRNGASMSHPEVGEGKAIIQQLGGVKNRTLNRKGIQYKVSERHYAVFPQTSGTLTFRPTVFQGVVSNNSTGQPRDPFGLFNGRQIRRFSEPLALEVKTRPDEVKGNWLPAQSISLNTHWQRPASQLRTGEPVTLTIAIIADGLMAEQLPELKLTLPKGLKGYSNQPELSNNQQGTSLIGTRQERWILIGSGPGEYVLPEISLEWWNLNAGKVETAVVPATQITVTGELSADPLPDEIRGGAGLAESGSEADATGADKAGIGNETGTTASTEAILMGDDVASASKTGQPRSGWFWLLIPGVLSLIGLGMLYRRHRNATLDNVTRHPIPQRVDYYRQLEQACRNNEAQKAYDALSDWVRHDLALTPPTLARLRQTVPMSFKQALDELSMSLYAQQANLWRGETLWYEIEDFQQDIHRDQEGNRQRANGDLLNLYPD